jgi:hypothetical protein
MPEIDSRWSCIRSRASDRLQLVWTAKAFRIELPIGLLSHWIVDPQIGMVPMKEKPIHAESAKCRIEETFLRIIQPAYGK